MENITSARAPGEQFRNLLADIKRQLDQTTTDMSAAMGEQSDTAKPPTEEGA
jgi:hypothetical protein